jgi:hypothetical protein
MIKYRFLPFLILCSLFQHLHGQGTIKVGFEGFRPGAQFTRDDWNSYKGISVNWADGFGEGRAFIDSCISHSGKNSLRVVYPASGVGSRESGAQAPLKVKPASPYFVSYWMRFDTSFVWGGKNFGGKLPGLGGGDDCSGCLTCNGENGFSARLMWRKNGKLVLYLYHMDKKKECGEDYDLLTSEMKPFVVTRGSWVHVAERVKVNSTGNADGEVQVWLNGTEALLKTGIRFVTNSDKADNLYFSTFFGGSGPEWAPGKDCFVWFDDIVISTSPEDAGISQANVINTSQP